MRDTRPTDAVAETDGKAFARLRYLQIRHEIGIGLRTDIGHRVAYHHFDSTMHVQFIERRHAEVLFCIETRKRDDLGAVERATA